MQEEGAVPLGPGGRPLAGPPRVAPQVPAAVRRLAAVRSTGATGTTGAAGATGSTGPTRPPRLVWENELGGLTYELAGGRFAKWAPAGSGLDLAAEAERLRWVAGRTRVPAVLDLGGDPDGTWLLTSALDGDNAVSPRWRADPSVAVRAIGEGLRSLHDALPVAGCPFSWSVPTRLAAARRRGAPAGLSPEPWLASAPPVDRLVVCHGDACSPNTLLDGNGRVAGHVDLGALGVADRWADLAVATYSTIWNYGPGWEQPLLDAYGIAADPARTAFYRGLWDAT